MPRSCVLGSTYQGFRRTLRSQTYFPVEQNPVVVAVSTLPGRQRLAVHGKRLGYLFALVERKHQEKILGVGEVTNQFRAASVTLTALSESKHFKAFLEIDTERPARAVAVARSACSHPPRCVPCLPSATARQVQ